MALEKQRRLYGYVSNGILDCSAALTETIKAFEAYSVVINIERFVTKRSTKQNAYYFGVVEKLIREAFNAQGNNFSQDEIHDFIKLNVWKHYTTIEGVKVARSSKELNTQEWEEKMTITRVWAAERGIDIPEPNEDIYASN